MSFGGYVSWCAVFWVAIFFLNIVAWARIERTEGISRVDRVLLGHPVTMAFALLAAGICICGIYARRATLSIRMDQERAKLEHEHRMRLLKLRHREIEKAAGQDIEL